MSAMPIFRFGNDGWARMQTNRFVEKRQVHISSNPYMIMDWVRQEKEEEELFKWLEGMLWMEYNHWYYKIKEYLDFLGRGMNESS